MTVNSPDLPPEAPVNTDRLDALIESGDAAAIKAAIVPLHPADVADLLNALGGLDARKQVFAVLPAATAATALTLVSQPVRAELLQDLPTDDFRRIVEEPDSDDAADLLESVSKEHSSCSKADGAARGTHSAASALSARQRRRPDAGGYAAVLEGATVEEAVEIVRTLAEAVADIHNVFVVDHRFHLLGTLPLARLILARAGETVDAADRQVVSVTVDTDQEEVARLFRKHDLVSLPVTDPRGALLGRITVDDVVDVLEEEANEDFSKLSGLGEEEPLFDSPGRDQAPTAVAGVQPAHDQPQCERDRYFSGHDSETAIAAWLMTIVAAQGGNAGVQTLTVMVRGLALGKVSLGQARSILLKELAVACGNGLALGLAAGVVTYLLHHEGLLALVLGAASVVNFLVAALVGSLIPPRCGGSAPIRPWLRASSSPPAQISAASSRSWDSYPSDCATSREVRRVSFQTRGGLRPSSWISKICGIRTSSGKSAHRLGHRAQLQVAPFALICLRQERIAPSPELSTNRSSPRSKITFRHGSRSGATSRLNSLALPASSCSPGSTTTVTSPIVQAISIRVSPQAASSSKCSFARARAARYIVDGLADDAMPKPPSWLPSNTGGRTASGSKL